MAFSKIRVLVVDDSPLMRSVLATMINSFPDMEVVGEAPDAPSAREAIKQLNPDVLTLDVHMPGMDGLEFLERLMRLQTRIDDLAQDVSQSMVGSIQRVLGSGRDIDW